MTYRAVSGIQPLEKRQQQHQTVQSTKTLYLFHQILEFSRVRISSKLFWQSLEGRYCNIDIISSSIQEFEEPTRTVWCLESAEEEVNYTCKIFQASQLWDFKDAISKFTELAHSSNWTWIISCLVCRQTAIWEHSRPEWRREYNGINLLV
jgi:hypothetical protein